MKGTEDGPAVLDTQYAELTLWSRDIHDQPQAVLGFGSALRVHGLSDLDPATLHMIVPPGFRKAPPKGVQLHRAELQPGDVQDRGSYRVTTPLRTLTDVLWAGTLSPEHVQAAVRDVLTQGLVRRSSLKDALGDPAITPSLRSVAGQAMQR